MALRHEMEVNGLKIGVHHPEKGVRRGEDTLAPTCEWPIHRVSDYANVSLPDNWKRSSGPNCGAFFVGTNSHREMWFDFRTMLTHAREVAVLVSMQGVNALSVRPMGEQTQLEQYVDECPEHHEPLDDKRYCASCRRTWPYQNYIAINEQNGKAWIDGFRTAEDLIRQFVFTTTQSGTGVAQQIMGEARAHEIGFAIFLSNDLKPAPQPTSRYRHPESFGGGPIGSSGSGLPDLFLGGSHSKGIDFGTLGGQTRGGLESLTRGVPSRSVEPQPTRREAISTEVSGGRRVKQDFSPDPHPLTHWQPNPAGIFLLNHADNAFVQELTRNGPTVDRDRGGDGALAGLNIVGE